MCDARDLPSIAGIVSSAFWLYVSGNQSIKRKGETITHKAERYVALLHVQSTVQITSK